VKLVESTALTDTGRKRRHNEDSHVYDPPLFVVADGMGGAQAGEVASGLVVAAFRDYRAADHLSGAERLAAVIREANRRIYERATKDTEASGMGTTVTAALVDDDRIALAHVGDSRAYLIREGKLEQLTQDHSLVADLVRSGRLTPEEAEVHPQRSVITRALGTDADVDVDTTTFEARPGDVFLLCSDGLSSMVADDLILRLASESARLDEAARALIQAANRNGGDDNITAVLFRLDADDAPVVEPSAAPPAPEPDLEDTLTGDESVAVPPEAPRAQTAVFSAEDIARLAASTEQGTPAPPPPPPPSRRRRRRFRWFFWGSLITMTAALVALAGAFWGLSRANFVGADEEGHLAVYQGVPWELGGGVKLYRARYVSQVQAVQLSAEERSGLFDHDLTSYAAARDKVSSYEEEAVP
jgi:protein phosphatase